jgi:uncharacterized protein involved in type VI secretion and phage assembly
MWGTTASPSRRRLASTLAAFVSLAIGTPVAAHAQVAVVVNPSNTLEELSLEKLRRLFLGQVRSFPTGTRARLAWTRDRPRRSTGPRSAWSRRSFGPAGWR